jgi:hypothetical protein
VPWAPELFSAPVLQELLDERRRDGPVAVPFFVGLLSTEHDALVESFAGEPELHDPVRGRVRGAEAFKAYADRMRAWLVQRNVTVEDMERVILERRGFEEVVLHFDGADGPVDLPFAVVADHPSDGRLTELRTYYRASLVTGRPASRPPVLQPDPALREPDVAASYRRALAAGDVDASVAAFEPDGYAREAAGGRHVHHGPDALRAYHERLLATGGIPEERCVLVDDGRACALEYNAIANGATVPVPRAAVAVHVRGPGGRLAAVRVYDDADPADVATDRRFQPWKGE